MPYLTRTLAAVCVALLVSAPTGGLLARPAKRCAPAPVVRDALRRARRALRKLNDLTARTRNPERRRSLRLSVRELEREIDRLDHELVRAGRPAPPRPLPPPPPPPEPEPAGFDPPGFTALLAAMDAEAFRDGKLRVLRSAIGPTQVTVQQLRAIMRRLPFGDDRVEAATLAHPHLVDPQRFFEVYQELVHESEKDELRRRVGGG